MSKAKFTINLMKLRLEFGLTQEETAKRLGISTGTYIRKENGKNKFLLDEAYKLAKMFDTNIERIFFDE